MKSLRAFLFSLFIFTWAYSPQNTRANDVYLDDYNYFAILPDSTLRAKFQVGIRAPIISQDNPKAWDWSKNIWLFYQQKSFWEIGEISAPFSEHNFNPGVYYSQDILDLPARIDTGFEHISNGESGDISRSLNRLFIRSKSSVFSDQFLLDLKLWAYNGGTEPEHIYHQWGYGKVSLTYYFLSSDDRKAGLKPALLELNHEPITNQVLEVRWSGQLGTDTDFYGSELSLIWPLKGYVFNPELIANWWYGYGERMLTLEEKESILRIGLMFNIP